MSGEAGGGVRLWIQGWGIAGKERKHTITLGALWCVGRGLRNAARNVGYSKCKEPTQKSG